VTKRATLQPEAHLRPEWCPVWPTRFVPGIVPFAELVRRCTWRHADAPLLGAILTAGVRSAARASCNPGARARAPLPSLRPRAARRGLGPARRPSPVAAVARTRARAYRAARARRHRRAQTRQACSRQGWPPALRSAGNEPTRIRNGLPGARSLRAERLRARRVRDRAHRAGAAPRSPRLEPAVWSARHPDELCARSADPRPRAAGRRGRRLVGRAPL
jgi:hypothetical protein